MQIDISQINVLNGNANLKKRVHFSIKSFTAGMSWVFSLYQNWPVTETLFLHRVSHMTNSRMLPLANHQTEGDRKYLEDHGVAWFLMTYH